MDNYERAELVHKIALEHSIDPLSLYLYVTEYGDFPRDRERFRREFYIGQTSNLSLRYEQARAKYIRGLPDKAA